MRAVGGQNGGATLSAMAADLYELLGVPPTARAAEIRAAYRALMRDHHPDLHPGDPGAEEMARRLTAAWAVLGRPSRRAAYDSTRAATGAHATMPPRPAQQVRPAYSPAGTEYRRAFHLASRKVATVVLLLGIVALLAFSR